MNSLVQTALTRASTMYNLSRIFFLLLGMTCQARTSYTEDEVLWGHRFFPVISLEKDSLKLITPSSMQPLKSPPPLTV